MEDEPSASEADESKAERKQRKQAEKLAEARPLDSWERFRALSDLVDHELDVIEMADRRTRFALVLLGMLNAANILIALRADLLGASGVNSALVFGYVGCYLLLSLFFLLQAILALKPRARQMGHVSSQGGSSGLPGVRLVDDILRHSPDAFYELWRTTDIGTLNRELALQVHLMARTTVEKFGALNKVYNGLMVLVVLTAIFLAILGLNALFPTVV
jgi:hypothetical protein